MNNQTILRELKSIEAHVSALIQKLESENLTTTATIGEVRRIAVLEEVFRLGGQATPQKISNFAKKYGKTPSSTAGYYSGKSPSMASGTDPASRVLTPIGTQTVQEARQQWGADWLERIPLNLVSNELSSPDLEISF